MAMWMQDKRRERQRERWIEREKKREYKREQARRGRTHQEGGEREKSKEAVKGEEGLNERETLSGD